MIHAAIREPAALGAIDLIFVDVYAVSFDICIRSCEILLATHARLGAGDAIVAATAIDSGAALWTTDRDFEELIPLGLSLF